MIWGAVTMSLIGAAMLALIMQPTEEAFTPSETSLLAHEYDQQLNSVLNLLIANAQIGPDGRIFLRGPMGDQRFIELHSGRYWQISGEGQEDFASRSLGDRKLRASGRKTWAEPLYYDSDQFPNEPLRVIERTVRLSGSDVDWQFIAARSRDEHD
jgi:hypothetical protein